MEGNIGNLMVQQIHRHGLSGKEGRGSLSEASRIASKKETKASGSRQVAWNLDTERPGAEGSSHRDLQQPTRPVQRRDGGL